MRPTYASVLVPHPNACASHGTTMAESSPAGSSSDIQPVAADYHQNVSVQNNGALDWRDDLSGEAIQTSMLCPMHDWSSMSALAVLARSDHSLSWPGATHNAQRN